MSVVLVLADGVAFDDLDTHLGVFGWVWGDGVGGIRIRS